jgi:hypothetical protein
MPVSMSDEMIMDRVRQGKLEEAGLLYERYYPQLYNFYLRISFNREIPAYLRSRKELPELDLQDSAQRVRGSHEGRVKKRP